MLTDLLLAGLLLAAPQTPAAPPADPPSAPELAEAMALKAENHLLRLRVVQLEAQIQQDALTRQRAELDAAITAAHPGWHMDWTTGRLVPDAQKETTP